MVVPRAQKEDAWYVDLMFTFVHMSKKGRSRCEFQRLSVCMYIYIHVVYIYIYRYVPVFMFTYILFGKQITGHHWLANRKSTLRPKRTFATVSGDGRYTTFPTQHILYCLLLFMHIYIYIYLYQFYIYSHIDSDNHIQIRTLIALGKLLLSEDWNPRIQESLIRKS